MSAKDARRRAESNYRKRSVRQVTIRLYKTDAAMTAWLDGKDNMQGYIKQLIREDMARSREGRD